MGEALHENARRQGVGIGAGLALDGGRIHAFAFAIELTIVPVEIAVGSGEDEQAAAFFDEFVDLILGVALQTLHIGHDDDFLLAEVLVADFSHINFLGANEILESGSSDGVGLEGNIKKVRGAAEWLVAGVAIDEQDIELIAHLHDGVKGVVISEAVAFEADGE